MESKEDVAENALQDMHEFIAQQTASLKEEDFHIPSIVDSITQEEIDNFQPVHKRYYEEKYLCRLDLQSNNIDTCIRVHTNKLCIIYLSDKHVLFEKRLEIDKFNFQVTPELDRSKFSLSGKAKRGAPKLEPNSILCYIETTAGQKYPVYAGVHGKLLEVNDELENHPNLAIQDNVSDGFIAIILPEPKLFDQDMSTLSSTEQYLS